MLLQIHTLYNIAHFSLYNSLSLSLFLSLSLCSAIPTGVGQPPAGEERDSCETESGTQAVWPSPDQEETTLPLCLH